MYKTHARGGKRGSKPFDFKSSAEKGKERGGGELGKGGRDMEGSSCDIQVEISRNEEHKHTICIT